MKEGYIGRGAASQTQDRAVATMKKMVFCLAFLGLMATGLELMALSVTHTQTLLALMKKSLSELWASILINSLD